MKTDRNPRGAGRKPGAKPKDKNVNVRITQDDYNEWSNKAAKLKLTLTAMIELAVKKLGE